MSMGLIDQRAYKFKQAASKFFCPLCRTERAFSISPRLSLFNYFQILVLTSFIVFLAWPIAGLKSAFSIFAVWTGFEFTRRALFKKEIPCPHCGFDASWYKKDVKKARELVENFWKERDPTLHQDFEQKMGESSEQYPYSYNSRVSKEQERVSPEENSNAAL